MPEHLGSSQPSRDGSHPTRGTDIAQEEQRNLTELYAPEPVQQQQSDSPSAEIRRNHHSKNHPDISRNVAPKSRGSDIEREEEQELNELVAPKPIQTSDPQGQWRRQEDLETAQSEAEQQSNSSQTPEVSEWATRVYTISSLIFFAILGTLARLGVQWLTFYPGAPIVIDNIWANFGGTLFMGFLSEDRQLFRQEWGSSSKLSTDKGSDKDTKTKEHPRGTAEARAAHSKVKKTIPLFVGLTTGFCGSFTSFSTFMRDVFYALANELPSPINHPSEAAANASPTSIRARNNAYSLEALLSVTILTFCLSISALYTGAYFAKAADPWIPTLPFRFVRRVLDPLIVVLGIGCWLGAVFMCIWPPDRPDGPASLGPWSNESWRGEALFAIAFAPVGCLLRWYASLKLNSLLPWFPLGTFSVNMFGTAVLSMCLDFQHVPLATAGLAVGGGRVSCQVLQGIEDGFCGALTTVSTWVVELTTLRSRHGWFYGFTSWAVGFALTVIIMGSVKWSVGWTSLACPTGNTSVSGA